MADTLIIGADVIVTMDDARLKLQGADILLRGGVIAAIGPNLPRAGCQLVNAAGTIITPGLVNTHHHLYQTLTRAVPGA